MRKLAVIAVVVAALVVAYLLWFPSLRQTMRAIHQPPPGVHGSR